MNRAMETDSIGAGGRARTCTPLREGDFKTRKKGQQFNVSLSCCLFSLRGLRIATVFYEGYGHPGGQRPLSEDTRLKMKAHLSSHCHWARHDQRQTSPLRR